MPWISGAAIAGSSIVGDIMSQQGQQATNAMSTANMLQNEQWQTQMSNTAMQRRVEDLKAAGLNPMLAIGQGGASVPGVGLPSLGNPGAAFGQFGNQIANAMQTDAQIQQIRADAADKTASAKLKAAQTPDAGLTSAQIAAMTQASTASAEQSRQSAETLKAQIGEINARIKNLEAQTTQTGITNQYLPQLQQLQVALNSVNLQLQRLQIPEAQFKANVANAANAMTGTNSDWFNSSQNPLRGTGETIGGWIHDAQDKLATWWQAAKRNSYTGPGPNPYGN